MPSRGLGRYGISWALLLSHVLSASYWSTLSIAIHSFIDSKLFTDHLLCAQHCWGHSSEQGRELPAVSSV